MTTPDVCFTDPQNRRDIPRALELPAGRRYDERSGGVSLAELPTNSANRIAALAARRNGSRHETRSDAALRVIGASSEQNGVAEPHRHPIRPIFPCRPEPNEESRSRSVGSLRVPRRTCHHSARRTG